MANQQAIRALWIPSWYGLDQSIFVGLDETFLFFEAIDPQFEDALEMGDQRVDEVFFCGTLNEKSKVKHSRFRVLSISHQELGPIQRVDAYGLDYRLQLGDGQILIVNAEEEPGVIVEPEGITVTDWRLLVKLESVCVGTKTGQRRDDLD